MDIYRCMTKEEVFNKFKNIDADAKIIRGANTHAYKKNLSYIHFFRYKKCAQYYFNTCSSIFNPFVLYMTASIPDDVLKQYLGYGYYGYSGDNYNGTILLPEYAIPKNLFKTDYIKDINTYINNFEDENNIEYKKYLEIFKNLMVDNKNNINKTAKFLKNIDLDEILKSSEQKKLIKTLK